MGDTGVKKAEAIYAFLASFGIETYETYSVPDDAAFPRLTYDLVTGDFGQQNTMPVNLWYRSTTLVWINAMVDKIADRITAGGIILPCDGGHLHLYCGSPFAQSMDDPEDDLVKRKYLNITIRYNTVPRKEL